MFIGALDRNDYHDQMRGSAGTCVTVDRFQEISAVRPQTPNQCCGWETGMVRRVNIHGWTLRHTYTETESISGCFILTEPSHCIVIASMFSFDCGWIDDILCWFNKRHTHTHIYIVMMGSNMSSWARKGCEWGACAASHCDSKRHWWRREETSRPHP